MKTLTGVITSLKNKNTAVVTVTTKWQHPLYKKYVKRSKKYASHYEDMDLELGQEVVIGESRPISKTKRFRIMSTIVDEKPAKAEAKVSKKVEEEKTEAKPETKKASKTAKKETKKAKTTKKAKK